MCIYVIFFEGLKECDITASTVMVCFRISMGEMENKFISKI